jgi:hypothetical protein
MATIEAIANGQWGPKKSDGAVPVSAKNVLCDVMRVVGPKEMYTYVYFVNICVIISYLISNQYIIGYANSAALNKYFSKLIRTT